MTGRGTGRAFGRSFGRAFGHGTGGVVEGLDGQDDAADLESILRLHAMRAVDEGAVAEGAEFLVEVDEGDGAGAEGELALPVADEGIVESKVAFGGSTDGEAIAGRKIDVVSLVAIGSVLDMHLQSPVHDQAPARRGGMDTGSPRRHPDR